MPAVGSFLSAPLAGEAIALEDPLSQPFPLGRLEIDPVPPRPRCGPTLAPEAWIPEASSSLLVIGELASVEVCPHPASTTDALPGIGLEGPEALAG